MSTSPAKRRACERCWKRKQQCDRQTPTCQKCREAAVECRPRTISGNDDDDEAGFVGESYVQTLKRKISRLEDRRHEKRPCTNIETDSQSGGNRATRTRDEPESAPGSSSVPSVHNALADLGHFGLNTTPRDPGPLDWRPKPFALWSLAHTAVRWSSTGAVEHTAGTNTPRTTEAYTALSSEDTMPLMKEYVESVLSIFPFMDTRDLFAHDDRFLQATHESQDPHGPLLTCLALATACTRHRRAAHVEMVAAQARSAVSRFCANMPERDPVSSMQCLVAAALYSFHGTSIESASYLVRLALSKAVALGFHRAQNQGAQVKWRIIAVLYVLERSIGFAIGQPSALDDCDIAPEVLEQGQPAATCLVLNEMMQHARLITMLRHSRQRSAMYFATTYRTWVEATGLAQDISHRETFLRLRCRLLVSAQHLMNSAPRIQAEDTNETYETLSTFREWLQCLEARQDLEDTFWVVLDPYEIAAVGILSACVYLRQIHTDNAIIQISREVQLLAISLLSYLSGHFSAAAPVRKLLSQIFNQQSIDQSSSSYGELPRKLREMLQIYSAAGS